MKKLSIWILVFISAFVFFSCQEEQTVDPTEMLGDVTFFTDCPLGNGVIYVTFRNATMQITRGYGDTPSCGAQGCATFENVPIGTYSYKATMGLTVWNGEVTIYEGLCSKINLRFCKSDETMVINEYELGIDIGETME